MTVLIVNSNARLHHIRKSALVLAAYEDIWLQILALIGELTL